VPTTVDSTGLKSGWVSTNGQGGNRRLYEVRLKNVCQPGVYVCVICHCLLWSSYGIL